jgi:hypothetical protein
MSGKGKWLFYIAILGNNILNCNFLVVNAGFLVNVQQTPMMGNGKAVKEDVCLQFMMKTVIARPWKALR